jgi:hypothetical protein
MGTLQELDATSDRESRSNSESAAAEPTALMRPSSYDETAVTPFFFMLS